MFDLLPHIFDEINSKINPIDYKMINFCIELFFILIQIICSNYFSVFYVSKIYGSKNINVLINVDFIAVVFGNNCAHRWSTMQYEYESVIK